MTFQTGEKIKNDAALAGIGQRLVARFIDGLIIGCIMAVMFGAGRETGASIGFLITAVYEWYCLTRRNGQTFGKTAMGIRVVKADGSTLSDVDAVIRYLMIYLSTGILALGLLWAVFDDRRRGWHDLLAGTIVIKAA